MKNFIAMHTFKSAALRDQCFEAMGTMSEQELVAVLGLLLFGPVPNTFASWGMTILKETAVFREKKVKKDQK